MLVEGMEDTLARPVGTKRWFLHMHLAVLHFLPTGRPGVYPARLLPTSRPYGTCADRWAHDCYRHLVPTGRARTVAPTIATDISSLRDVFSRLC